MNETESLYRRALRLEYFTIGYNILEAVASIVAGGFAGSIALIGFGLDSIVESLSGMVLLWRLHHHGRISAEEEEKIEARAVRFVGITFLLLGAYVLYESVHKIVTREVSDVSLPGIVIAVLSIIIMPLLARAKMNTGRALGLRSLIADAKETIVCSLLSVALLLGLLARWLFNFTLADPIVGLVIVLFLFREGYELVFLGGCSCGDDDECGCDDGEGCCGGGCGCGGDDCCGEDDHDCCGGGCGCSGDDDCGSEKNHDKKEKGCGCGCR